MTFIKFLYSITSDTNRCICSAYLLIIVIDKISSRDNYNLAGITIHDNTLIGYQLWIIRECDKWLQR